MCLANVASPLPSVSPLRLLPLLRGGAVSGLLLCLRAKPLDCLIAILTFNTAHRALLKVGTHTQPSCSGKTREDNKAVS
jgi:hypothetical protein